jgi:hypothetical protein
MIERKEPRIAGPRGITQAHIVFADRRNVPAEDLALARLLRNTPGGCIW